MTVEKIQLKRQILQDIGRDLDAQETELKNSLLRTQGARAILAGEALAGIQSVNAKWRKDEEEEVIDHDTLDVAIKVCEQCAGCLRNLIMNCDMQIASLQGGIQHVSVALSRIEKCFETEGKKAQALLDALEREEIVGDESSPKLRVIGTHPGKSEAQLRKAASAVAQEDITPVEALSEASPAEAQAE